MKKLFLVIVITCSLKTNGQNYLISFAGSGASTTVSSVKAENLTTAETLIINGDNTLRLTIVTGVPSLENRQASELKIYPNPMTNNALLQVYPPSEGSAIITVTDMTGRLIIKIESYLENSPQEFLLSGMNSGLYLIRVNGNNYQYSGKLLCNVKESGRLSIEKISNNQAVGKKLSKIDSKGVQTTVDMVYAPGDILKFTGISGNYSSVKTDIPYSDKTITFNFIPCVDGDNINYSVVEIGTQIWMAENLRTTKYRNGDLIGTTSPSNLNISGETNPTYQWAYEGNESNAIEYGRMYTWYSANDIRNICPSDWHLPSNDELSLLLSYLGTTGGKLKENGTIHWQSPNTGATNETGFTALPGGFRADDGTFHGLHAYGYWWNSNSINSTNAMRWYLYYNNIGFVIGGDDKKYDAFSVRCIKN